MPFRTEKLITRSMMQSEPETLFVFGDNMRGTGRGGQASIMRGEPNAVGIPTKWIPTMAEAAFFTDDDLDTVRPTILARFDRLRKHLREGGDVVWPADGIGTGRAELKWRAPRIWSLIESMREHLEKVKGPE